MFVKVEFQVIVAFPCGQPNLVAIVMGILRFPDQIIGLIRLSIFAIGQNIGPQLLCPGRGPFHDNLTFEFFPSDPGSDGRFSWFFSFQLSFFRYRYDFLITDFPYYLLFFLCYFYLYHTEILG